MQYACTFKAQGHLTVGVVTYLLELSLQGIGGAWLTKSNLNFAENRVFGLQSLVGRNAFLTFPSQWFTFY
jgi:hypothetical protein